MSKRPVNPGQTNRAPSIEAEEVRWTIAHGVWVKALHKEPTARLHVRNNVTTEGNTKKKAGSSSSITHLPSYQKGGSLPMVRATLGQPTAKSPERCCLYLGAASLAETGFVCWPRPLKEAARRTSPSASLDAANKAFSATSDQCAKAPLVSASRVNLSIVSEQSGVTCSANCCKVASWTIVLSKGWGCGQRCTLGFESGQMSGQRDYPSHAEIGLWLPLGI